MFLCSNTIIGQNFHTEFEYEISNNNHIKIQNSYPKGGQKFITPGFITTDRKEFVYVTFWTCISNETSSNLELEIDFSADSFYNTLIAKHKLQFIYTK